METFDVQVSEVFNFLEHFEKELFLFVLVAVDVLFHFLQEQWKVRGQSS